jgi:Ni,Fe-hydrogenase III small subunit
MIRVTIVGAEGVILRLNEVPPRVLGLVEYCRINGKVLKNEGLLDGQASVVIPVEILIP